MSGLDSLRQLRVSSWNEFWLSSANGGKRTNAVTALPGEIDLEPKQMKWSVLGRFSHLEADENIRQPDPKRDAQDRDRCAKTGGRAHIGRGIRLRQSPAHGGRAGDIRA